LSKKNCRKTFLASSSEKCNLNTKIELWRIAQKGFITPVVANTRVKVRKAPSSTGAATEAWREVTVRADVGKGGAYWKILDDGWYDVQAVVMNGLNEVRSSDIERVNVVTESSKVPLRLDLTLNAAKRGRGPA